MIDKIFMFIHFFSNESDLIIEKLDNDYILIKDQKGKDLYFRFDIKNKKNFKLSYDFFYGLNYGKLVYVELDKNYHCQITRSKK